MRKHLLILAAWCLLPLLARAQSTLPSQFAGWQMTSSTTLTAAQAEQVAGDAAPALREYGLKSIEQASYGKGAAKFAAVLYTMQDPSAAFGADSMLRTPEMAPSKIAEHAYLAPKQALVLQGNQVLEISGDDVARLGEDLKPLLEAAGHATAPGSFPSLPREIPEAGLVTGSDRYLLGPVALHQVLPLADGDWLGFGNGAEAVLARYRRGGQEMTLLLVDYPTPQLAVTHLNSIAQQLEIGKPPQPGHASLYAKRALTHVALVVGARTKESAEGLLREIGADAELTWNEPTFSLTDPSTVQMLLGVFSGTGLICLFTLGAGLAFSIFRLLVKRLFPGKVFDRPESLEILQLGLSSKPIRAKDLY
jgi:hypothetical protein